MDETSDLLNNKFKTTTAGLYPLSLRRTAWRNRAKKPFRDYPLITRLMVSEKELVAFIEDVKAGRI